MPDNIGTGPYSGGAVRSNAATVLQVIRRKIELKTQLALETSRLETLLPTLTPEENAEVRAALAKDAAALDADVARPGSARQTASPARPPPPATSSRLRSRSARLQAASLRARSSGV